MRVRRMPGRLTMDGPTRITAVCEEQGCEFDGGAVCIRCGYRLRCACGCFVREDNQHEHYRHCAVIDRIAEEERRDIVRSWG